jgi:teichuronic acid biosynthesis glycosyltransferase TuaG
MNNPLISIITPAYNAERFIAQTVQSVQNQSYQNWEHLIVVDHNSKDKTLEMVREWSAKDPRIKLITSPQALGATKNRNLALDLALGEYIAFLDADDLWPVEKLEKQLRFMQEKSVDFSYTAFNRVSMDGAKVGHLLAVPAKLSYSTLLYNNAIGCLTVMVKKSLIGNSRFQEYGWEDMSLWLGLLKKTPFAYGMQESLALYRIVPGSRSNNKKFAAGLRWDTYRKVEGFSVLKSAYYFAFYAVSAVWKYSRF